MGIEDKLADIQNQVSMICDRYGFRFNLLQTEEGGLIVELIGTADYPVLQKCSKEIGQIDEIERVVISFQE